MGAGHPTSSDHGKEKHVGSTEFMLCPEKSEKSQKKHEETWVRFGLVHFGGPYDVAGHGWPKKKYDFPCAENENHGEFTTLGI